MNDNRIYECIFLSFLFIFLIASLTFDKLPINITGVYKQPFLELYPAENSDFNKQHLNRKAKLKCSGAKHVKNLSNYYFCTTPIYIK